MNFVKGSLFVLFIAIISVACQPKDPMEALPERLRAEIKNLPMAEWNNEQDFSVDGCDVQNSIKVINLTELEVDKALLQHLINTYEVCPMQKSLQLRLLSVASIVQNPKELEGIEVGILPPGSTSNILGGITITEDNTVSALVATAWYLAQGADVTSPRDKVLTPLKGPEEVISHVIYHELLAHAMARAANLPNSENTEYQAQAFELKLYRELNPPGGVRRLLVRIP